MKTITEKVVNLTRYIGQLTSWLLPLSLFLLASYMPKIIWKLEFNSYLRFLDILVWPVFFLIIIFSFRKVVTYMFFSLNSFSFFGTKGTLKDVGTLIDEEVKKEINRSEEKAKIEKLEEEINNQRNTAETWEELAKKSFTLLQQSRIDNNAKIKALKNL